MQIWQLSASELVHRFHDGSLTPLDAARDCLARLDAVNPKINAVVARRDGDVLAEAGAATARYAKGAPLSAIDGVPLTVKDSLYTCDLPTTWGTLALKRFHAEHDEASVGLARAAGALIVGKTNVPEFALEGYTDNPVYGPTRNPWDVALTPGGSSGGAVAAVASGIAPLAIGQDGGGSIRRPASHAGVVGLKPTLGVVAREHVLPSLLLDFEVIGPLTRTVEDARLLFNVMRGASHGCHAGLDPASSPAFDAATGSRVKPGMTGSPLRIRYVERLNGNPLDPQIAASVAQAVGRLAALGHHVEQGPFPLDLGFYTEAWPQIGQIGLAHLFDKHPQWETLASRKYREMADKGRHIHASRLWNILEQVKQLRRDAATLFSEFDLIVMPSAAALPWRAEDAYPTHIDGVEVGPRGHAVYTGWVNAAGLPGLALPCAPSREGLPIGMQIVGPHGADDLLLDIGAAYEAAHPWAQSWPAL